MSDIIETGTTTKGKLTPEKILEDFKISYANREKWIIVAREDMEFSLGKQWDDADVAALDAVAVRALTINKIRPNIFLLTGIQSQNRSDFKAYPEGQEDGILADLTSSLLKHTVKVSDMEYKHSEQFEEGITSGECYLEPYLDYDESLVNPDLKWKKVGGTQIFPGKFCEYDMSDARYVCKLVPSLTKDDLLELFPEDETKINNIAVRTIDTTYFNAVKATSEAQQQLNDNYHNKKGSFNSSSLDVPTVTYDMIEYYYKKLVRKSIVIDKAQKRMVVADDEDKAAEFHRIANERAPGSAELKYRMVPEIWMAQMVGDTILTDEVAWFYPRWKKYPFIPYFAYRVTMDVTNTELLVQGIVRSQKDLNRDYNKRRTQELRHLNQSANSGWQMEEGSVSDEDAYRKFGAAPGVILKYKQGRPAPVKITPTPLSQGHVQVAGERAQEMKDASGINADLLAMNEAQASGKAITLRMNQGMVMVQKLFDNNSRTKRLLAQLIMSQFGELYDVEKVMRVMGDKWILDNFGMPVMQPMLQPQVNPMTGQPFMDPATGQPAMAPVIDPATGQPKQIPILDESGKPALEMTPQADKNVRDVINHLLNDPSVVKYDINVGETIAAETLQYANYMMLQEMVKTGAPIPPEELIDASTLNPATKNRIKKSIEAAQKAQAEAAQLPPGR